MSSTSVTNIDEVIGAGEQKVLIETKNKHISQLSASIVSENYVILGNPFSACRLCWKPKPEEKDETEEQTPEKWNAHE